MSRILGVMHVRDEWPLCALSIAHALTHVDELVVVDSGSDMETRQGVTALAAQFPGRMHWLENAAEPFDQSATAYLASSYLSPESGDWIYHADADEFLLLPPDYTLREYLENCESDVVEYALHNWIAPVDFDDRSPSHYRRLSARSVPTRELPVTDEDVESLRRGERNYFDFHFLPKVIFRWRAARLVTDGSHRVMGDGMESRFIATDLRSAHLPYLSRRRLELRVRAGTPWLDAVTKFSWQSQLVAYFAQRNQLDDFWRRHCVHPDSDASPPFVRDDALVAALEPHLELLEVDVSGVTPEPASFGLAQAVPAFRYLIHRGDQFETELLRAQRHIAQGDELIGRLRSQRRALENSRTWRILTLVQRLVGRRTR